MGNQNTTGRERTVPELELAKGLLPLESLFAAIPSDDDGIAASELMRIFTDKGVPRLAVMRLVQAEIDTGRLRLGRGMRLIKAVEAAAA